VEAMRSAIEHVVRSHEILHTTFVERDGRPSRSCGRQGRWRCR
jgi:hypothetical protein